MAKELWEIKYRPTKVEDYLFQNDKHKESIQKFIDEKSIPHLLLDGHRGTGKTSLAILLKNELGIDDSDFMVINASDENNVDTMRNKIKGFISTFSMSGFKLVLLDEADRLSGAAQDLLRSMMEEYSDNARFILSGNRGYKITKELKSRCFQISFKSINKDDMAIRVAKILKAEKVKVDIDNLDKIIDMAHPDMRKAIQLAQNNSVDGVLQAPSEMDSSMEVNMQILQHMENNDYVGIRGAIAGKVSDDEWEPMYKFLYEFLHEIGKFKDEKKWKAGVVILADHLYRHSMVADPEINAMAMFIRLGEI